MIRVLLADDQMLVRAGFRALLDAQDDIEVVGEAADGDEAVRLARETVPDVVLMDIRMPGMDGLEATRRIGGDPSLSGVRVIMLTTFDLDEHVFEAIGAGASGFLVKDTEPVELLRGVRLAQQTTPDVVLMDIRMPGVDGLEATRRIAADPALSGTKVVILTTFELDEYVFEALRTGASGFLVKDTEPVELLRGVRAVAAGDALLSPSVTRRVIGEFATPGGRVHAGVPPAELAQLTDREREVMVLVGEGLSNDEIASRLVISPATAKTHVSRAMIKLGARDRAQLVVYAYEAGLIRPGWLN